MLGLCHYGPALLRFWFQTDLGHALVTLYVNFYALIGQNLTDGFMRKIYVASWKLFTLRVFTWHRGDFRPERVHSGSLSWVYVCLHDTTTKCHAGKSHLGVSSPRFLYRGENFTPAPNLPTVSCINAKRPPVWVWNGSTGRLERVAYA